jgi:carbon storage regulator
MLVLNRRVGEQIVVPQVGLVFTVLEVQGDKVSVGITAPRELKVHRREVWERIQRNGEGEEALEALPIGAAADAVH